MCTQPRLSSVIAVEVHMDYYMLEWLIIHFITSSSLAKNYSQNVRTYNGSHAEGRQRRSTFMMYANVERWNLTDICTHLTLCCFFLMPNCIIRGVLRFEYSKEEAAKRWTRHTIVLVLVNKLDARLAIFICNSNVTNEIISSFAQLSKFSETNKACVSTQLSEICFALSKSIITNTEFVF